MRGRKGRAKIKIIKKNPLEQKDERKSIKRWSVMCSFLCIVFFFLPFQYMTYEEKNVEKKRKKQVEKAHA